MAEDSIVKEVRKIRKEIEDEVRGDPDRYYAHLWELQEQYRSRLVRAKEKGQAGGSRPAPEHLRKPMAEKYVGRWRITEMELWEKETIEEEGPGFIEFGKDGLGRFHFGLVDGDLDYRIETVAETELLQFSFLGTDEMTEVSGRGWVRLSGEELEGRLVFHQGDSSGFKASRMERGKGRRR